MVVDDPLTARGLAALGWSLDEDRLLALTGPPTGTASTDVPVTAVTQEVVGALWRRSWRRAFPSASEDVIDQLDPDHRGGGRGAAVVHAAVARARAAGADLVLLAAVADDWPREWYTRLGFIDVGVRYQARRPG